MKLVVFFSRGMSLDGWRRAGILDRELALYRILLPRLEHLAFLTYGGAEDLALASQIPGVEVLTNRWRLPANLYSLAAPLLHRRALAGATVFKTNQINGAWCAVLARWLFGKKLVVRCGFLWADFVARLHPQTWRQAAARRLERAAFRAADLAIVATEADKAAVVERYRLDEHRVHVISNYVDTDSFRPMPDVPRDSGLVIFIGRFEAQKNVMALVDAAADLEGVSLVLVGGGVQQGDLQEASRRRGANVRFLGRRPHAELPGLLNRSAVFVLPSHYEGNPKALLEAMACGVPVIATRVPGIREIVVHRQTGYLCGTSSGEIHAALLEVLGDIALRVRMSEGAVAYVREHASLHAVATRELALLQSLRE